MKKYLLLLIFFLFIPKVKGIQINYSDYGEFSDWQEEYVESSELVDVEIQQRFKWYKFERENGDYYIESYNSPLFPYRDADDYFWTDDSEYSPIKPISIPNRIINTQRLFQYRDMKPIKYIYFLKPYSGYLYHIIPEINVFIDEEKIAYNVYCSKCSGGFASAINDGDIYQTHAYIYSNHFLRLDLKGYYDASRIRVEIYWYDNSLVNKHYELAFSAINSSNPPYYFYQTFDQKFYCNDISEVKKMVHTLDHTWLYEPEWFDWEQSDNEIEPSLTREVDEITLYNYRDLLYRYYQLNKVYYDDNYYLSVLDYEYQPDENDYQYYYRYRTREILTDEEPTTDEINNDNDDIPHNNMPEGEEKSVLGDDNESVINNAPSLFPTNSSKPTRINNIKRKDNQVNNENNYNENITPYLKPNPIVTNNNFPSVSAKPEVINQPEKGFSKWFLLLMIPSSYFFFKRWRRIL